MNAALLIGAGAVIVPIAVIEVRRKLNDWRRSQQPFRGTLLCDDATPFDMTPAPMLAARISTPDPADVWDGVWHHPSGATYWVGLDLASGDELCGGHGVDSYTVADHSASGTSCDISSGGDA